MMLTQRQETYIQTDIPVYLAFPIKLYLNESSQCKPVKANLRIEEYFNHDTKRWISLQCDWDDIIPIIC